MKTKLLIGALGVAGCLGLSATMVSCSDNYSPTTDTDGSILVSVDLNKEVISSKSTAAGAAPSSRADAQSVSASDLTLKLISQSGDFTRDLGTAGSFTDPVQVPVGKYDLEASYGDITQEGYGKPYYFGSSPVEVFENRTTPVSCTARLGNSMVRVEFSDAFKAYFASYSLTLHSSLGNELAYTDASQSLYMYPGEITATIEIEKRNGTRATLQPKSFTAEARHSYLLRFDVNGGEVGDGVLVLTYDEAVNQEDVEIDLSDAILNAPAPKINAEGFTDGEVIAVLDGQPSGRKPRIIASAQAGIQSVILTTQSVYLESQGWPKEIDLTSGDAATIALMERMGLRAGGITRPERMAVVDFTDVLANIRHLEGVDNTSTFSLQVRDKNSRVAEKEIGFSAVTSLMTLAVNRVSTLEEFQTELEMYLDFNGNDITPLVIETKNERGTWETIPVTVKEAVAGETGVYRVVMTVPSTDQDIPLRLTIGNLQLTVTVQHSYNPYSLNVPETGVFAWQAAADVVYTPEPNPAHRRARSAEEPENVTFELSTDNGKTWSAATAAKESGNRYILGNLSAGTTYTVRANCNGTISKTTSFTTEANIPLDNAGMEDWLSVTGDKKYAGTCYWTRDYPGTSENTVWGTMNLKTTSSSSGTYQGCAYGNFSGTRGTTDANSGQKAAIIETVGWGDNTAPAFGGSGWRCKHLDAGQLYLGHYDAASQSPVYGIGYNSRPRSIEFYYKYRAKNSADYGKAFAKVLDASGNVIASAEYRLTAIGTYQKVTLDLVSQYTSASAKATTLQVGFISCDNAACLEINKNNMDIPGMWNLSDGRYTGSSLYIDDIQLNF